MTHHQVIHGALHPVVGLLFLEVIPDSEVGFADIYQLTDSECRDFLVKQRAGWRRHAPASDGRAWDEWVINEHLSRINWYTNSEIQRICREHGLVCTELRRWAEDVSRWNDILVPVEGGGDNDGRRPTETTRRGNHECRTSE